MLFLKGVSIYKFFLENRSGFQQKYLGGHIKRKGTVTCIYFLALQGSFQSTAFSPQPFVGLPIKEQACIHLEAVLP